MANIYNMADTWNDGATTFTAIKMNVTDTASDASSLLMDLQVGGDSEFSVSKTGVIEFASLGFASRGQIKRVSASAVGVGLSTGIRFASSTDGAVVSASNYFGFSSLSAFNSSVTADLKLYRDAANTLAQRNGANAQTFNIYNTYTDASNYERGFLKWNFNVLEIGTESSGSATPRGLRIRASGRQADINVGQTYNEISFVAGSCVFSVPTISMASLPTADPVVAGQLWNDAGTLKISAG